MTQPFCREDEPAPRERRRPWRMRAAATALLIWGWHSIAAGAAPAEWTSELAPAARQHLDLAGRFYSTSQWRLAVEEFRAAYVVDPHPKILYGLAQAYRMSGQCDLAIPAYREFIRSGPDPHQAGLARDNIKRCERTAAAPARDESASPARAPETPRSTAPLGTEPHSAGANRATQDSPALGPAAPARAADLALRPRQSVWYKDVLAGSLMAGSLLAAAAGGVAWQDERAQRERMTATRSYDEYSTRYERAMRARQVSVGAVVAAAALFAGASVRYSLCALGRIHVAAGVAPGGWRLVVDAAL